MNGLGKGPTYRGDNLTMFEIWMVSISIDGFEELIRLLQNIYALGSIGLVWNMLHVHQDDEYLTIASQYSDTVLSRGGLNSGCGCLRRGCIRRRAVPHSSLMA